MPAGDQIDCYLSCNVRINKGELKKRRKKQWLHGKVFHLFLVHCPGVLGQLCGGNFTLL